MIQIMLSESEVDELRNNRFMNPDPEVQRRAEIVLLSAHDISHAKISDILDCHRNTITNVLHRYEAHGIPGLASLPRPGRRSVLTPHIKSISESLDKDPVRSVNEACERIKDLTGIVRKPSQVRCMLHDLGFKRLVSGAMPCPSKKTERTCDGSKKVLRKNNAATIGRMQRRKARLAVYGCITFRFWQLCLRPLVSFSEVDACGLRTTEAQRAWCSSRNHTRDYYDCK